MQEYKVFRSWGFPILSKLVLPDGTEVRSSVLNSETGFWSIEVPNRSDGSRLYFYKRTNFFPSYWIFSFHTVPSIDEPAIIRSTFYSVSIPELGNLVLDKSGVGTRLLDSDQKILAMSIPVWRDADSAEGLSAVIQVDDSIEPYTALLVALGLNCPEPPD